VIRAKRELVHSSSVTLMTRAVSCCGNTTVILSNCLLRQRLRLDYLSCFRLHSTSLEYNHLRVWKRKAACWLGHIYRQAVTADSITPLLCTLYVPGSNLGPETSYTEFLFATQSFLAKYWDIKLSHDNFLPHPSELTIH
jgi:hypothetical protein